MAEKFDREAHPKIWWQAEARWPGDYDYKASSGGYHTAEEAEIRAQEMRAEGRYEEVKVTSYRLTSGLPSLSDILRRDDR